MKFLLYDLLGRTYLLQYLTDTWSRFIRLQWWSIMWLITLQKIKFILISELTMCVFIDRMSFLLFLSSEFSSSLVFSTHQICWILLYSPQSDVSLKDAVCRFVLSSVVSRARLMYDPEIAHFFLCLKTFRYVSQHNHLPMFPRPSVAEAGDANSCCSFRVFNLQSLLRVRQLRCLKLLYPETQKSIRE